MEKIVTKIERENQNSKRHPHSQRVGDDKCQHNNDYCKKLLCGRLFHAEKLKHYLFNGTIRANERIDDRPRIAGIATNYSKAIIFSAANFWFFASA